MPKKTLPDSHPDSAWGKRMAKHNRVATKDPDLIFKPANCARCSLKKVCAVIPSEPPAPMCLDCLTLGFGQAAKAFARNPFRLGGQ